MKNDNDILDYCLKNLILAFKDIHLNTKIFSNSLKIIIAERIWFVLKNNVIEN